jgi:4-amino-4-deoxy-L-arabinose transferase-like glycosyltransferase
LHPRHLGFLGVVALSAVLNTGELAKNGYANIFYSAGVKSMTRSLHNFFFVSFDPGGLVTVDKPPLALWVQALSAKLFGFSPLSLLLPEALAAVLAVALLYVILARRLGAVTAFAGALGLAVFPSFVAVSRDNGVDPVLILLMVAACGAGMRACETGRWRTLLWSAALIGLAFNTKTLAAYLAVPGIAAGYLLCAPPALVKRIAQLLVAGLVMAAVSFAWIAVVEATPASQRPYVGSSTNNTELGLTFEYNGVGRVNGEAGGPGQVSVLPGAFVPADRQHVHPSPSPALLPASGSSSHSSAPPPATNPPAPSKSRREKNPIPFGGAPSLLRLFGTGLGDQSAWMLPFALVGLLALLALVAVDRLSAGDGGDAPKSRDEHAEPTAEADAPAPWRRDPRLACALVFGGWLVVEAAVLSKSTGIVHPYYVSALGPGVGAMGGAGAVAFVRLALARGYARLVGVALAACAVLGTVAAQDVLLRREHYMEWIIPVLAIGAIVALGAFAALRVLAWPALAAVFGLLLIAPGAYSTTTWLAPVEGTFPVAGPTHTAGVGGYGISKRDLGITLAIVRYAQAHARRARWAVLTVASDTAAPMILNGFHAGAVGGYSGTDPALSGPGLARLVARGEARYMLLGGDYSQRGGNGATRATLRYCTQLEASTWHSPVVFPYGLVLFDCKGHERELAGS